MAPSDDEDRYYIVEGDGKFIRARRWDPTGKYPDTFHEQSRPSPEGTELSEKNNITITTTALQSLAQDRRGSHTHITSVSWRWMGRAVQ
jgi:hypothetical protein